MLPCQGVDISPALQQRPAEAVKPSARSLFVIFVFNIIYHLFGSTAIPRGERLIPSWEYKFGWVRGGVLIVEIDAVVISNWVGIGKPKNIQQWSRAIRVEPQGRRCRDPDHSRRSWTDFHCRCSSQPGSRELRDTLTFPGQFPGNQGAGMTQKLSHCMNEDRNEYSQRAID